MQYKLKGVRICDGCNRYAPSEIIEKCLVINSDYIKSYISLCPFCREEHNKDEFKEDND